MLRSVKKCFLAVGIGCLLGMTAVQAVWADEPASGGHWINIELGPGVAQWVEDSGDENQQPAEEQPSDQTEAAPETQQADSSAADPGSQSETQTDMPADTQTETQAETQTETQEQTESQSAGRVIDPNRPMIALTFDDGPQPSVGNLIMDCLAAYGGRATFFVVGNRCPSRAAELQRMVAEGHEIANHSYDHRYFNKLNGSQIQDELNRANDTIQAACGVRPALVRLPGGNINNTVRGNVLFPMIMWSIDTLDWKTRNTQNTVNTVLSQARDGDIVLMHELYDATGAAALQIIPELTARGYQLVTVSEMAQARGVPLEAGRTYSAFRP